MLNDFIILALPKLLFDLINNQLQTFNQDVYFAASQTRPGNAHFETSQPRVFDFKWQVQFFDSVGSESYVLNRDFSIPYAYFKVVGVEVLDVLAHDAVDDPLDNFLKHMISILFL